MGSSFDKEELLEELDGDREFLDESLEMLDQDAPALLAKIRAAVEQGDSEAVYIGAHTLQSMVGNFCAQPAFEAALKLESLGRKADLPGCRAKFPLLESEIGRLQKELRAFLDEI